MAESRLLYYEESFALNFAEQNPVNDKRKGRVIISEECLVVNTFLQMHLTLSNTKLQICTLLKSIFSCLFRHSENAIPDYK